MQYLVYILVRICIAVVSLMPLKLVQHISTVVAWLLRIIIRYRVDLVETHLMNSFPEKTDLERARIKKAFYLNLSDTLLETIKGYSMSDKSLIDRFSIKDNPELDKYYEQGQSVIAIGAHLANWEWGSASFSTVLKHHVILVVGDITNKHLDQYITDKRQSDKVTIIKTREIISAIKIYQDLPSIFILVADQCPSNVKHALWTDFLHRDTPFIHSPEKLAKKYKLPCFYAPLERIERSKYEVNFVQILSEDITQDFVTKLETTIRRIPEQWLWTHRRWKRQHMKPKK